MPPRFYCYCQAEVSNAGELKRSLNESDSVKNYCCLRVPEKLVPSLRSARQSISDTFRALLDKRSNSTTQRLPFEDLFIKAFVLLVIVAVPLTLPEAVPSFAVKAIEKLLLVAFEMTASRRLKSFAPLPHL